MTKSEQICNEIGAKFFCKDFVYENLKYFKSSNNKVELSDGLFEYSNNYVALQIKEKSLQKDTTQNKDWLENKVYGEAVGQILATIDGIKNDHIVVNDLYHQPVVIHNDNFIFPVIIFDNVEIETYARVIRIGEIRINVFSINDYKSMMEVLRHPYDIIDYLQKRSQWCEDLDCFPKFAIGENKTVCILHKISNESDFADFFLQSTYDGNPAKQDDALRLARIIAKFRENQIKKNPNYKKILNILQMLKPEVASAFMERFRYAWSNAHKDKFDISKSIQIQITNKKISMVFFSVGVSALDDVKYYKIICDAKQQQQKADSVLLIAFVADGDDTCNIDWIYFEHDLIEDSVLLDCYEKNGLFDGTIDRKQFDLMCYYLFSNNN